MKKYLLIVLLISFLISGCKKSDNPDYSSLIPGTWVNTRVADQEVLTDASFVMELRSDKVEVYSIGYKLDDNNKTWIENDKYSYSVKGNSIIFNGVGAFGGNFHIEFKILSVDELSLTFSVSKFLIDNEEYPDLKIYNCKKVTTDLRNQLVGTWYGKSTTPGNTDNSYHYWEYLADGNFNYYFQDSTGQWIRKPDNEGHYYLYGDLLSSNYSNDLLTGGSGKSFECWNINIIGTAMFWAGLRDNGQVTSFHMDKVAGPPISR